jgi:hypothetical protein
MKSQVMLEPHQIYSGLANAGDWWFDFKPWKIGEIQAEKNAVEKLMGLIILVTHPSKFQTKKT